jgi:hypothetical protein
MKGKGEEREGKRGGGAGEVGGRRERECMHVIIFATYAYFVSYQTFSLHITFGHTRVSTTQQHISSTH